MAGRQMAIDPDELDAEFDSAGYDSAEYDAEYDEAEYDDVHVPTGGPHDADDLDPEVTEAVGTVDFGAVRVPVSPRGTVAVEPPSNGRMQAVHVSLPEGRLSVSALAAPKSSKLWPELSTEIVASLRDGGARVRSYEGDWGRELHATTGGATSVFVGVDGARWMLYGVATGPTSDASALDVELRRMLRGTVVVRGRSPYPVRTVLPLTVPEHLAVPAEPAPEPAPATNAAASNGAATNGAAPNGRATNGAAPNTPAADTAATDSPAWADPVRRIADADRPGAPAPDRDLDDAPTEVWPPEAVADRMPTERWPAARPPARRDALGEIPAAPPEDTETWTVGEHPIGGRRRAVEPPVGPAAPAEPRSGRRRAPEPVEEPRRRRHRAVDPADAPQAPLSSATDAPYTGRRRAAEPVSWDEPRPGRRRAPEPPAEPTRSGPWTADGEPPTTPLPVSTRPGTARSARGASGGRHAAPDPAVATPVTELRRRHAASDVGHGRGEPTLPPDALPPLGASDPAGRAERDRDPALTTLIDPLRLFAPADPARPSGRHHRPD